MTIKSLYQKCNALLREIDLHEMVENHLQELLKTYQIDEMNQHLKGELSPELILFTVLSNLAEKFKPRQVKANGHSPIRKTIIREPTPKQEVSN